MLSPRQYGRKQIILPEKIAHWAAQAQNAAPTKKCCGRAKRAQIVKS